MLGLLFCVFVFAVLCYRERVAARLRLIREIAEGIEPVRLDPNPVRREDPRDAWPIFAGYRVEPSPRGPYFWPSNILGYFDMPDYETAMNIAEYIGINYRGDYKFAVYMNEFGFCITREGRHYCNIKVKIFKNFLYIDRGCECRGKTIYIPRIKTYSDIDVIMGYSFDYRPRRFTSLPLHLQ